MVGRPSRVNASQQSLTLIGCTNCEYLPLTLAEIGFFAEIAKKLETWTPPDIQVYAALFEGDVVIEQCCPNRDFSAQMVYNLDMTI